jgi:hypothetical protein
MPFMRRHYNGFQVAIDRQSMPEGDCWMVYSIVEDGLLGLTASSLSEARGIADSLAIVSQGSECIHACSDWELLRIVDQSHKEAEELLDTARLLRNDANKTGFDFINSELDISKNFANRAWSLFGTGDLAAAKVQGIAAKTAYDTAKRFLPNLGIPEKQQELLIVKLGTVTPLIDRLATII